MPISKRNVKLLSTQAQIDRRACQQSLYYLCKEVLGYKDMVPHVHADICHFATDERYGRFRQATVPRSHFKTWVYTIGKSIWLTLPDEDELYKKIFPYKGANCRTLIASNVIDNAAKMVNKIKREWETNERLKAAFPELVPTYNKTRWSDHCAEVNRTIAAQEGTYTAVGVGGSVISQHFDHIIEDDLIYANKDDFTGEELMPNQEDIDNAIGWHKLAFSLLADPQTGCMDNVGTRWAPHDLIDYIRKREPHYACFELASTKRAVWPIPNDSYCIWPERYNKKTLEQIRDSQGPKIFETQYLNRPRSGEDVTFDVSYINKHDSIHDYPTGLRPYTFVDLASWKDKKRICNNVVLTGARDANNEIWIHRVDSGKFNPTRVIELMNEHQMQFNSKVMVEEVGYQVAIRHFAHIAMSVPGANVYTPMQIPPDNRKGAKELRINSLEPLVRNGMVHVLSSMKSLVQEMEDYPYGSTKDILDIIGYLVRHARPSFNSVAITASGKFTLDKILEELESKSGNGLLNQLRKEQYATHIK